MFDAVFSAMVRILPSWLFFGRLAPEPTIVTQYAKLMKWSKKKGLTRHHGETVSSHAARISRSIPQAEKPLWMITGLYEKYRYGQMRLTKDENDCAIGGFRQIKRLAFKGLKKQKGL